MNKVMVDGDGTFKSFADLIASFEDHIFKALERRYSKKGDEVLFEVINKINNSLLRRLSPLL